MPKTPPNPAAEITFRCASCALTFASTDFRIDDDPSRPWHPWEYHAECRLCGDEVPQVSWEKNLFKAHSRSTGPVTDAGKLISAKNLAGHPTPEEAKRTRFNALKHGATAKTAIYFPAKPGKYPACSGCDVDWSYCAQQIACVRRTDLMMRYLAAVETGDLTLLNEMHAINQANLAALFSDMITTIIHDGVKLTNPVYSFDKDGGYHEGDVQEVRAHPLFKPLMEMLSRNSLSMSDLNLTPKIQTDHGIEMGRVIEEQSDRDDANVLRLKQMEAIDGLKAMFQRAQARLKSDPVLIEYEQDDGQIEAES